MKTALRDPAARISEILCYLICAAAVGYIITYLAIAYFRIQYPFELEWMEGGIIDHTTRILDGEKLYVRPSLSFTPYIYPPLYFYLSAAVSRIFGVGFVAPRIISFLASIGNLLIIFLIVRRKAQSILWGIIGAGLFAATYRVAGAWFDIARVDSLFLFLILLAIYMALFRNSAASSILSGVLVSLAFLTKQSALLVAAPLALHYLVLNRRRFAYFAAVTVVISGGTTFLMNAIHNGWYYYYVFELPREHTILGIRYLTFWTKDLLPYLPVALLAMALFIARIIPKPPLVEWLVWIAAIASMLGIALMGRVHPGGYVNVLIPAYAILSIVFGIVVPTALRKIQGLQGNLRTILSACLCLACLFQFYLLRYDPISQVPSRSDLEAGQKFLTKLSKIDGDVLIPYHGYYTTMVGKRSWTQQMAISDILKAREAAGYADLIDDIRTAVSEQRFGAIVLDKPWYEQIVREYYGEDEAVFDDPEVFFPVTGHRTRPERILIPREQADVRPS